MSIESENQYSVLDSPEVTSLLFHPREETPFLSEPTSGVSLAVPVEDGIQVGARFHLADTDGANILFFHGNGEIVSDYDDLGPLYNRMGVNFLPVDYRGYGSSDGRPTVSNMMRDCHRILAFTGEWLSENGYSGPLIVMGRSLGSASALELASSRSDALDGLILESGFALAAPLLRLLGVDPEAIGFREARGFSNLDKIRRFPKPTLIVHAEQDQIIPFSDGKRLYEASGADQKRLVKIPDANHNDIFARGLSQYLSAVMDLVHRVSASHRTGKP